jgi:UDP-GlcNAc:undecaprenyl-phosphate GlcNAc-1-phosphate transferase
MLELSVYFFAVSLTLSLVFTRASVALGRRWGVLDFPGPRKMHSSPLPLSGGWAILAALTVVIWGHLGLALAIRGSSLEGQLSERTRYLVSLAGPVALRALPIFAGAIAIFALGLADDLRGMSVRRRLVYQFAIATALSLMGFHPELWFLPRWLNVAIGILWIVGITNAINLLDGLDGLATGIALIATAALGLIMTNGRQPVVALFLVALAGVQLGFLRYNFNPAKTYLGSSGSLLLGYLLAIATLSVTYAVRSRENWLAPVLTPLFVLAIPLYDTASVVLIRLLHKRPVAIGDQNHFHHRLHRFGFSHRSTVVFMYLLAFSIALSAVRLVTASLSQSALILAQILGILAILILAERVAGRTRPAALLRNHAPPVFVSPAAGDADKEALDADAAVRNARSGGPVSAEPPSRL